MQISEESKYCWALQGWVSKTFMSEGYTESWGNLLHCCTVLWGKSFFSSPLWSSHYAHCLSSSPPCAAVRAWLCPLNVLLVARGKLLWGAAKAFPSHCWKSPVPQHPFEELVLQLLIWASWYCFTGSLHSVPPHGLLCPQGRILHLWESAKFLTVPINLLIQPV